LTVGIGLQASEYVWIKVDAELSLFHLPCSQAHLVVGIEADCARQALHRSVQGRRLPGVGVAFVRCSVKFAIGQWRRENDFLLLRKLRFAAKTAILIAVVCLVWGSTWIVIAGGLADLPPLTSAAARFGVAAVAMSVVAHFLKKREGGEAPSFGLSLALGTLNFGACYGLVYWSETRLPSALVSS
jgi:hypothetical protein